VLTFHNVLTFFKYGCGHVILNFDRNNNILVLTPFALIVSGYNSINS